MSRKNFIPIAIVALTLTSLFCCYILYIKFLIIAEYKGQAPDWFGYIVNMLYPRFIVEKQRFDIDFFLKRADQIVIRTAFFLLVSSFFYIFYRNFVDFRKKIKEFWNTPTTAINVSALRVLFYLTLIYIFYDAYADLILLEPAKTFYKPVALLSILHIGYPSPSASFFIYVAYIVFCILSILNIIPVAASLTSSLLLILIEGLFFSFEKIDHGFTTLTYASLLFPFILYERKLAPTTHEINGWALKLITVIISLAYFYSGLEKLTLSGFEGMTAESFRAYLYLHNTTLGLLVAHNEILCIVLPLFALALQLCFPLILFFPKLKYLILPAGILFHAMVYLLFDVGAIIHPWSLSYIFFIDWTCITKRLKKLLNFLP